MPYMSIKSYFKIYVSTHRGSCVSTACFREKETKELKETFQLKPNKSETRE